MTGFFEGGLGCVERFASSFRVATLLAMTGFFEGGLGCVERFSSSFRFASLLAMTGFLKEGKALLNGLLRRSALLHSSQ